MKTQLKFKRDSNLLLIAIKRIEKIIFTVILFSFICLYFTSCKKDRTCTCTTTYTGSINETSNSIRTIEGTTKKGAKTGECANTRSTNTDSNGMYFIETNCNLN